MISRTPQHLRLEHNDEGITTVWIDVLDRSMNVFHEEVIRELDHVVSMLETDAGRTISAVIFRSAKLSGFFAGADVHEIAALKGSAEVDAALLRGQELFARIEALPMRTIAAIHGPCLGGGLEFALACQHRIALNDSVTKLGLPEIQLGLIPGWGGTQRLPKLIGLMNALPLILKGSRLSAQAALKLGVVDAVADAAHWEATLQDFAISKHDRSVVTNQSLKRRLSRWVLNTSLARNIIISMAKKQVRRQSSDYPALQSAITAVAASSSAHGYKVERAEFAKLITTNTARNLLNLFLWREKSRTQTTTNPTSPNDAAPNGSASALHARHPSTVPTPPLAEASRLGVVGAGAMGAGIAQLAALKGCTVVMKELNQELADAGLRRVEKLLDDMVAKKRMSQEDRDTVLSRVSVATDYESLSDCDVVIEAVVEKMDAKRAVFASLDAVLKADAIIVSNTSALSVTEMAAATSRMDRVAGLHFFNPVHRMDLVEVIRCHDTSTKTVAALLGFVKRLGKTPVVTRDTPGFLVNRVLFPYIGEAVRMVMEGSDGRDIDKQVKRFGMPMGPLELIDHVGLDVAAHVAETLKDVLPESQQVIRLLTDMVARGWMGRKSGRGFYAYAAGKPSELTDVTSLVVRVDAATADTSGERVPVAVGRFLDDGLSDIQRRLLYPMINEVGFCMQDSVVEQTWMADLAMILGTGFAPCHGGPMTFANSIGRDVVLNNLRVLSARHGERFKPSAWLVEEGFRTADSSTAATRLAVNRVYATSGEESC